MIPMDRGEFEEGEFIVLLVLPRDRPVLVNLFLRMWRARSALVGRNCGRRREVCVLRLIIQYSQYQGSSLLNVPDRIFCDTFSHRRVRIPNDLRIYWDKTHLPVSRDIFVSRRAYIVAKRHPRLYRRHTLARPPSMAIFSHDHSQEAPVPPSLYTARSLRSSISSIRVLDEHIT